MDALRRADPFVECERRAEHRNDRCHAEREGAPRRGACRIGADQRPQQRQQRRDREDPGQKKERIASRHGETFGQARPEQQPGQNSASGSTNNAFSRPYLTTNQKYKPVQIRILIFFIQP